VEDSALAVNFAVEGGARPEAEIRRGDYLEVVEFSAFDVNVVSGDLAGEIRLGYLHQNGRVRIVTGGSVSGKLEDAIPTMRFSRETEQYDNFVIPRVTRLKNLKIAGVCAD
jgi:PmbA protein